MNNVRNSDSLIVPIILLILVVAGTDGCQKRNASETARIENQSPKLHFQTATVEEVQASGYVEVSGTVISQSTVPISTKLMAEIKQLKLEIGQHVTKGQVLAVLDDSDIVAMRSEAAAYRAEAQAGLSEVMAVRQQAEAGVAQAQAALGQSKSALADAQRDLQRSKVLFTEDVIPRSQLDKAQLAVDIAEQNVERAKAAISQAQAAVAQAGSKAPQVEAKKQQASAKDLQAASLQSYAVLHAPFDGIVTAKYFEQGQLSVPGQPLLVIEQQMGRRISASIPDTLARTLQVGSPVQVELNIDQQTRTLPGKVAILGLSADPGSRTIPIEVSVDQPTDLSSGQFVRLLVPDGRKQPQLRAPASCICHDGEQTYVWRLNSAGVASRVPVDLGTLEDASAVILRGVSAGDSVVLNPTAELYDGVQIQVGQG